MSILKCDESNIRISHFSLIKGFVATEKSFIIKSKNCYCFMVDASSHKKSLKSAVESLFSVKVKKINILNTADKNKNFKGNSYVKNGFKKAYVTLEKDSKINID